jgi:hypothetical protein
VILEIYDEMQRAMETGQPYQTQLDPPTTTSRGTDNPRTMSKTFWYRWKAEGITPGICEAMQRIIETGQLYQTRLDPPLADPRVAHALAS